MVDYFFSGNQFIRITRNVTGSGTMDAGYPKPISAWGWGSFGASGIKASFYSGGSLVPPPSAGLVSNSNYYLTNCNHITGASVSINIDEDLSSEIGLSLQLNAYSAAHNDGDSAQQYVIILDSENVLWGQVENFTAFGEVLVVYRLQITSFNTPSIPKGSLLQISLANDSSDRITGVTFKAFNASGDSIGSQTITLKHLEKQDGDLMTDADLAPITAFQLNIVGPYNSMTAAISSGFGTIVYNADQNMTVRASAPSCIDNDYATGEQANTAYSKMPAAADTQLSQYFETTSGSFTPSTRTAKVVHSLKWTK